MRLFRPLLQTTGALGINPFCLSRAPQRLGITAEMSALLPNYRQSVRQVRRAPAAACANYSTYRVLEIGRQLATVILGHDQVPNDRQ
jgi:hypothetical protein